jgi:predicted Zn finger-like uncharacterized protein
MIIVCPNCTTRFAVADAAFAKGARKLKCARCEHIWFHSASGPEEYVAPPPAEVPPAPPQAAAAEAVRGAAARTPSWDDIDASKRRRIPWLGILAGGCLAFAVAAVAMRDVVTSVWPQSKDLYAAIGLTPAEQGIEIRNGGYERQYKDGVAMLAIAGEVHNPSRKEQPVPLVRIALRDNEAREIFSWNVEAGVKTLQPGETKAFRTTLASPPAGAAEITFGWAEPGS